LPDGQTLAESLGVSVAPLAERARGNVPDTILVVADEIDAGLIVAAPVACQRRREGCPAASQMSLCTMHVVALVVPGTAK
jgi:hypothetical protein